MKKISLNLSIASGKSNLHLKGGEGELVKGNPLKFPLRYNFHYVLKAKSNYFFIWNNEICKKNSSQFIMSVHKRKRIWGQMWLLPISNYRLWFFPLFNLIISSNFLSLNVLFGLMNSWRFRMDGRVLQLSFLSLSQFFPFLLKFDFVSFSCFDYCSSVFSK